MYDPNTANHSLGSHSAMSSGGIMNAVFKLHSRSLTTVQDNGEVYFRQF